MYFNIIETQEIITGKLVLNHDDSFSIIECRAWDFQISIEPYPVLLLNFDYSTKLCVGIEGVLILRKKTIKREINIESHTNGMLKVHDLKIDKEVGGEQYLINSTNEYYDAKKKIFAIGDIETDACLCKIARNVYVKVIEQQIAAIYLQFD